MAEEEEADHLHPEAEEEEDLPILEEEALLLPPPDKEYLLPEIASGRLIATLAFKEETSRPNSVIFPREGARSRYIIFKREDFPAPLFPARKWKL